MHDLTIGSPSRVLWRFSLPLLVSMALQQIYNIVDSMIVGHYVGAEGLAAIGAAYPITLIFIAVATGASMGCSVVIGQLFGSHRHTQLKTAIYTAILSMLALGICLGSIGIFAAKQIMRILDTPDNVFADAASYLSIYAVGVIANFVYNTATAVYTGMGDSKRPLYFLLLSSVLNIVLDYIAVVICNFGIAGAAWATTISQYVAATLSTFVLISRVRSIRIEEPAQLFSTIQLKQMSRIAIPSIIQQVCVAFSHTILQRLVNSYGSTVMAGYEAASKIHNFAYMCMNTLGTAFSSFSAQNFGAKATARIREGFRYSWIMCLGFSVLVIFILQTFPVALLGLFLDKEANAEVVDVGVKYFRIISPDYLLISFIIISGGLLRGIGRIRDFLTVTLLDFFIRICMSYLLCLFVLKNYTGLFWAWYFGSLVDLLICARWYRQMCRKGALQA